MNNYAIDRLPSVSNLLIRMMLYRLYFHPPMVSIVNDVYVAQIGQHISKPIPFDATKKEIKAEFRRLIKQCKSKDISTSVSQS